MPTEETFNPARASKQINIPSSTLRHWARVYAEFLSPGANPGRNEERRFTIADVELLRAVAQLRANNLQPSEIIERLRQNPAAALAMPVETPTTPLAVHRGTDIPAAPLQTFLDVTTRQLDDVARRTESIDTRLQRVEHNRNLVFVAIAAFVAGVVLVGVIVWIVGMVR